MKTICPIVVFAFTISPIFGEIIKLNCIPATGSSFVILISNVTCSPDDVALDTNISITFGSGEAEAHAVLEETDSPSSYNAVTS